MSDESAETPIDALLTHLYRSRGFDFHGYKRASLLRRIEKRMQAVGLTDHGLYLDRLEVDPEEFGQLFNTILINVTSFFRDEGVWMQLRELFRARLAEHPATPEAPTRIWTAGCASGEEAYTLAMLMAEEKGLEACVRTTKIYATDIDDEALSQARQGVYSLRQVASVPAPLLEKYFDRLGQKYVINRELRRCVLFGRHNLIQDAPISRIDILSCRNTLMYFNREIQGKILGRFHFALKDDGLLVLGKAEMMLSHGNYFSPVDLKRRIFSRGGRVQVVSRALVTLPQEKVVTAPPPPHSRLRDAVFETGPTAQVVLDAQGAVVLINERARTLFGAANQDISRSLQELNIVQRGQLRLTTDQRPLMVHDIEWRVGVTSLFFDVQIISLFNPDGSLLGLQLSFVDISLQKRLQQDLQRVDRELSVAHEELQTTNEELETMNEELQSTVEELEKTNEELQTTNEELETMNEELQSTNEEFQSNNEELRHRSEELNVANTFMNAILGSLQVGVVVLDAGLLVRVWNHRAEDLWGVRQEEIQGKHFFSLDIGLSVDQLRGEIRACQGDDGSPPERVLQATNRRGKPIDCKVTCRVLPFDGKTRGIILFMEDVSPGVSAP